MRPCCDVGRTATGSYRGIDIPRSPETLFRQTVRGVWGRCNSLSSITLDRVFRGTVPPKVGGSGVSNASIVAGESGGRAAPQRGLPTWPKWHRRSWVSDAVEDSLSAETPRTEHARPAVDVNRPVTPWCTPAAKLAGRLCGVTVGLTSRARLRRILRRLREGQGHWGSLIP